MKKIKETISKIMKDTSDGSSISYNQDKDAFIPPQPYSSWILNEDTCIWEAPKEYPDDNKKYLWNEQTISWEEIE